MTRRVSGTVEATSPDGCVKARSRGGRLEALAFRPGTYAGYTEEPLRGQLARLGTLLYVEHERAARAAADTVGVQQVTDPAAARNEAEAAFLRGLQNMSVVGSTARGLVRFKIDGMARWRCRIAPGTPAQLPESAFVAETVEAAGDLLRRSTIAKIILKNKCFGSGKIDENRLYETLAR